MLFIHIGLYADLFDILILRYVMCILKFTKNRKYYLHILFNRVVYFIGRITADKNYL